MTDFLPKYAQNPQPTPDDPNGDWRLPGPMPKHFLHGTYQYLDWIERRVDGKYESPIEERLGGALYAVFRDVLKTDPKLIELQAPIGKFRADFKITLQPHRRSRFVGIVVECDGQEFHQSLEQRRRDRARDLWMIEQNYAVFRFTGADIHRSARACAEAVRKFYDERQPPGRTNGAD